MVHNDTYTHNYTACNLQCVKRMHTIAYSVLWTTESQTGGGGMCIALCVFVRVHPYIGIVCMHAFVCVHVCVQHNFLADLQVWFRPGRFEAAGLH